MTVLTCWCVADKVFTMLTNKFSMLEWHFAQSALFRKHRRDWGGFTCILSHGQQGVTSLVAKKEVLLYISLWGNHLICLFYYLIPDEVLISIASFKPSFIQFRVKTMVKHGIRPPCDWQRALNQIWWGYPPLLHHLVEIWSFRKKKPKKPRTHGDSY